MWQIVPKELTLRTNGLPMYSKIKHILRLGLQEKKIKYLSIVLWPYCDVVRRHVRSDGEKRVSSVRPRNGQVVSTCDKLCRTTTQMDAGVTWSIYTELRLKWGWVNLTWRIDNEPLFSIRVSCWTTVVIFGWPTPSWVSTGWVNVTCRYRTHGQRQCFRDK